ncbi:hypothetical protein [Undibacterium danionis]|uniref:Uncharacterized protein n=1 Tax=Undibacterium danionis TaxID=1812100 RepID=A0ABV6IFS2_9BURK
MKYTTIESDSLDATKYKLLVSALGFESRSTAVSEKLAHKTENRIALGFDHNLTCSYSRNLSWFKENDFQVISEISAEKFSGVFEHEVGKFLNERSEQDATVKIAIDISCFDRRRMAEILQFLLSNKSPNIEIDFWYCIGKFQPPQNELSRNEVAGPIHKKYTGRFTEPGKPLALVAGLGYEPGRVMGAAEYLQASTVVAFLPQSPISEYFEVVKTSNKTMLEEIEQRRTLDYDVTDPGRLIATLDSIIRGLNDKHNIILLPGGPKIFALCALIAGTLNRQVGVWRVSSCASLNPNDVESSGVFLGLRLSSHTDD